MLMGFKVFVLSDYMTIYFAFSILFFYLTLSGIDFVWSTKIMYIDATSTYSLGCHLQFCFFITTRFMFAFYIIASFQGTEIERLLKVKNRKGIL